MIIFRICLWVLGFSLGWIFAQSLYEKNTGVFIPSIVGIICYYVIVYSSLDKLI